MCRTGVAEVTLVLLGSGHPGSIWRGMLDDESIGHNIELLK